MPPIKRPAQDLQTRTPTKSFHSSSSPKPPEIKQRREYEWQPSTSSCSLSTVKRHEAEPRIYDVGSHQTAVVPLTPSMVHNASPETGDSNSNAFANDGFPALDIQQDSFQLESNMFLNRGEGNYLRHDHTRHSVAIARGYQTHSPLPLVPAGITSAASSQKPTNAGALPFFDQQEHTPLSKRDSTLIPSFSYGSNAESTLPNQCPVITSDSHCAGQPQDRIIRDPRPFPGYVDTSHDKKQLSTARTGQACDRCKQRKIKCDSSPKGCGPCVQNNVSCITMDRITHKPSIRGHTENIERENRTLRDHLVHLEMLLAQNCMEPRYSGTPSEPNRSWQSQHSQYDPYSLAIATNGEHQSAAKTHEEKPVELLPVGAGASGGGYLGITTPSSFSHVQGTLLSLFGMQVDLADFVQEEPSSPTSYRTMIDLVFRGSCDNDMSRSLPDSYEEVMSYSKTFLSTTNRCLPVLHGPTFQDLVYKVFHDGSPQVNSSSAEIVLIHMVLAITKWQVSIRHMQDTGRFTASHKILQSSHKHYHYSLSLLGELMKNRTLTDLQAIVLICVHVRQFSLPGPAWMLTSLALSVLKEAGIHRRASAFKDDALKQDIYTIERRKGTFWTLALCHTTLSAKLGRSLGIRPKEYDIEHMLPLNDRLEPETEEQPCRFKPAIALFKLSELYMEMYTDLYSIKPCSRYEYVVEELEVKADKWKSELPPELVKMTTESQQAENWCAAMWVDLFYNEFQMTLHHPMFYGSQTAEVKNKYLDHCMEASSNIICDIARLQDMKSLDTSWQSIIMYIAATFNLISAHWERRDSINKTDFERLTEKVSLGLNAVSLVSMNFGDGNRLRDLLNSITTRAMNPIAKHLDAKGSQTFHIPPIERCNMTRPTSQINPPMTSNTELGSDWSSSNQVATNTVPGHPTVAGQTQETVSSTNPALYVAAANAEYQQYYSDMIPTQQPSISGSRELDDITPRPGLPKLQLQSQHFECVKPVERQTSHLRAHSWNQGTPSRNRPTSKSVGDHVSLDSQLTHPPAEFPGDGPSTNRMATLGISDRNNPEPRGTVYNNRHLNQLYAKTDSPFISQEASGWVNWAPSSTLPKYQPFPGM